MNTNDDLTARLTNQLQDRVSHLDPSTVSFDRVKRTAGRIRRRRIAATSVAVAVTAVGVPGGVWWAVQSDDPAPDLQVAATVFVQDGPTPTLGPDDVDPVDKSDQGLPTLDPRDLPTGAPARVDWLQGRNLHTADGRVLTLDQEYAEVYRWDDGWLVVQWMTDSGLPELSILDGNGVPVDTFTSTGWVGTSADGSSVAYVRDQALRLHDNDTGRDTVLRGGLPQTLALAPVGISSDGAVHYNVATANTDEPWDGRIWRDGAEHDPSPGEAQEVVSVGDQGSTVRRMQQVEMRACYAVFGPSGGEQARTCDLTPGVFSPDGSKLLAGPNTRSGFGDLEFAVLGQHWGAPLLDFINYTSDGSIEYPSFQDSSWEDNEHALVVMATPGPKKTWYVVRVGVDGSAELAAEPVTAPEDAGIVLSTGG